MDLTALPSDTSPASVAAHISAIQATVEEQLMDIENVKTANSQLQRKIASLSEQTNEARKTFEDKMVQKKQFEEECLAAQLVVEKLKASAKEFEATIKQNNELEAKRVASVAQAQNLIKPLKNLSRDSASQTLSRAGKYIYKYCGQSQYLENEADHSKACYGRCKACKIAKLECDCGRNAQKFSACGNCAVKGLLCEKLSYRRDTSREMSVLKRSK